jgi:hypothetical protein
MGGNAILNGSDLAEIGVCLQGFLICGHMEREGVLLAVILVENASNGMSL